MSIPQFSGLTALALLVALPGCLGDSSASSSASGSAGSTGGFGAQFDGVKSASAISPNSAIVIWNQATAATSAGGAAVRYNVYRSFALDAAGALENGGQLIQVTDPAITSFVDTDLTPFTTVYYRVTAFDPEGMTIDSSRVTSARTPSTFMAGVSSYSTDILPLWSTADTTGKTCMTCHDSGATLDLSTYEGVMAGVGTLANPDTFVVPYDGDATWNEFVFRFASNFLDHGGYIGNSQVIAAMRQPLSDWVYEGALEDPDTDPPIFAFDNVANAGLFNARFVDYQTAEVTFFHAIDPESTPASGDTTGQLEYHVYAGETSAAIDWLSPVAVVMSNDSRLNPTMTASFPWTGHSLVATVRALDSSGRSVVLPDVNDPTYMDQLALRWRNMSLNETEVSISR